MDEEELRDLMKKESNGDPYQSLFVPRGKSLVDRMELIFKIRTETLKFKFDIVRFLTLNPKSSDMELFNMFPQLEKFTLKMVKDEWLGYYHTIKLFDSERIEVFKELPEDFYNSREYAEWGIQILKKFGYRCVFCDKPANHTDHLRSAKYYPELALNVENGIATCENCHKERHGNKWSGTDRAAERLRKT